jgi:uncharacterized protein
MSPERLEPVLFSERVDVLDVLRGFALFGILVANWRGFGWPAELYDTPHRVIQSTGDRAAQLVVDMFFSNKFIILFSLLFGMGFAAQADRAAARQLPFQSIYVRRVLVLAAIGLTHGFLLWWGDILFTYAVAAVFLLLLRPLPQRAVLAVGAGLVCLRPVYFLLLGMFGGARYHLEITHVPRDLVAPSVRAYLHGGYADILLRLAHDWRINNQGFQWMAIATLGWFALGMVLWRSGFPRRLASETRLLERLRFWGLLLGTAFCVGSLLLPSLGMPGLSILVRGMHNARFLANAALSAGYAAAIALLVTGQKLPHLVRGLGAAGRMALTNYLLQSVVGVLLNYGYGFGLYGTIGALQGFGLSMLVFACQVPLSVWWLSYFRFGPVEWLWRSLTYWQIQPMRSAAAAIAG